MKIIVTAGAIGLLLIGGAWMMRYRPHLLSGDGTITDSGFWSYPRYAISFPQIEVADGSHAIFRVNGLPRDPMAFRLNAVRPDKAGPLAAVDLADEKDWTITVRFRDDQEHEVYSVSAPLPEWYMARSVKTAYLWHTSLRDMSFSTRPEYTIEIRFSGPLQSTGVFLEPHLTGGGNELP